MKKKSYRSTSALRMLLPGIVIFAGIASMVLFGLKNVQDTVGQEELRLAVESINRAVITCYSIESRYPTDFEYLKNNYGISIDESRFIVHYEIFAENIMPDITIVRR